MCGVNRGIKLLRVIYNSNKYTIVDFVFALIVNYRTVSQRR